MSNFLLKELYQAHTIELRSIVIPRSKELGQFKFTHHSTNASTMFFSIYSTLSKTIGLKCAVMATTI